MSHDDAKRPLETPDLFEGVGIQGDNLSRPVHAEVKQQPPQNRKSKTKKARAAKSSPLGEHVGVAFLTDLDVAHRFRVTRQTIWRWAGSGHFPAPLKLSAGTSRWRLDEILAFERKLPRYSPNEDGNNAERNRT